MGHPSFTPFRAAVMLIVLLAAAVRLPSLARHPDHFDNDECVIGYDAWSVWETGADHHGVRLPNHFRAFNEYLPGLAQYIAAPFVGLLGLSETSTRLPFALLGVATVALTMVLARRWFGPAQAIVAGVLLALEPWHVSFSRLALTNSLVPFFVVLALLAFTHLASAVEDDAEPARIAAWLVGTALAFALLTRTYQPMKLQAPLLFGGCVLAWSASRRSLPWLSPLVLAYVLLSAPQWVDQLRHWELYQLQFRHNTFIGEAGWPRRFVEQWLAHLSPVRLFVTGLNGGESVRPSGVGQLSWVEGPLWIAAAVALTRGSSRGPAGFRLPVLLGWWFLIWPVAAALTISGVPTETRTIGWMPWPQLVAAHGAVELVGWLLARRRWTGYLVGAIVVLVFALGSTRFVAHLFSGHANDRYQHGLGAVARDVLQRADACDVVRVEDTHQAYIYLLFASRFPPAHFQHAPRVQQPVAPDMFNRVSRFANVSFVGGDDLFAPPKPDERPEGCSSSPAVFALTRSDAERPGWVPVSRASGGSPWVVYRRAPDGDAAAAPVR